MTKERKEVEFHLRLTQREKELLQRRAAAARMPLSQYLIAMGRRGKIVNYDHLLKCFIQLRRIGSNINQSVRIMNTFHSDCDGEFDYVLRQLDKVQSVLDQYINRELKENKDGLLEDPADGIEYAPEQSDQIHHPTRQDR